MSDKDFPSLIRSQFRHAAKETCHLKPCTKVDAHTPQHMSASGNTNKVDSQWSDQKGNTKSSAQVAHNVCHTGGIHSAGGLKPDGRRSHRIVTRFTGAERAMIVEQARTARLSISQYVRLILLKNPGLDPDRNRLLLKVNYQLSRHGTNLNQIAKNLNVGDMTPDQAAQAVAALRQEFSDAYRDVGKALVNGREYDDQSL